MKKIAKFAVEHSLFVNMLSVFLVVAGLFSMFSLRREAFPQVSFDKVTITTIYRGATPKEVEKLVTSPLEKELKEVSNIDEMFSISSRGISTIIMQMVSEVEDKQEIVDEIEKAVDNTTDLPEEAEEPEVVEMESDEIPIIIVSLSGEVSESILQEHAENLEDDFLDISGVASVDRQGYRDEEFWVLPDLEKMKEYYVSFDEIINALNMRNVSIPAGKLETFTEAFNVKTTGEFYTKEEIENVIIRANTQGNWVKIKDIAKVKNTFEEENTIVKVEGSRAVSLVISKRKKGDAVKIVDEIKDKIGSYKKHAPEELKIEVFYDMSYYIKRRLNVLRSNGIFSIIFIVGVLLLFLNLRPAILTVLCVPIAGLATFWVMDLFGISINLITMFGMIVVLGMLVDHGIIISENVYRYVEKGISPREAAIKGTSEVMTPVFTTVLTTLAAFSPLIFMTGIIGKFIKYIPLVICITLIASLMEAFVILPSHLADFVKPTKKEKKEKKKSRRTAWVKKFIDKYEILIKKALKFKYKIIGGVVLVLIASVLIAKFFMPFILFPSHGVEQFMIRAEAKVGVTLKQMNKLIAPVEDLVAGMPDEYLDTFETHVGILKGQRHMDPESRRGSNLAQINVYLTPTQEREKTAKEIIEKYRPKLKEIKQSLRLKKLYFREIEEGPPVGKPVYLRVRGEEYETLKEITEKIKKYLHSLDGVRDIVDDYNLGNKELNVVVDRKKATSAYLTVGQVASSIRTTFEGTVATSIKPSKAEEEIDVRVRLPESQQSKKDVFDKIVVINKFGKLIPLSTVASIKESQGLRAVHHLDGKRSISVAAGVDNEKITSTEANRLVREKFRNISAKYKGYSIRYGGEAEERRKSMESLFDSFILALLLIFLILASQFNSLIQPFVIMLAIPFGLIGVIIGLLIHNMPITFLAVLGIIGLAGIVVNDSIVLMDFINRLRKEGVARDESIIQAGKLRFRPVMLTTFTTVSGLATVAYGIGGKDPFLVPMAMSITWGLIFATGLTLIVIPCIYGIVDDMVEKVSGHHMFRKVTNKINNKNRK